MNKFLCIGGVNGQKPTELCLSDIERVVKQIRFDMDKICNPNRTTCYIKISIPLNMLFNINNISTFLYVRDYPSSKDFHGELGMFSRGMYFVFLDESRNDLVLELSKVCEHVETENKYYLEYTNYD